MQTNLNAQCVLPSKTLARFLKTAVTPLFLYDEKSLSLLKDDLKEIYKAKTILGLLYPYEELKIGFSDKIEIVYIFGNQSNENNNLKNILIGIKNSKQYEEISKIADIKIAKSSFMGYGLYEKNMMNLDYAINML